MGKTQHIEGSVLFMVSGSHWGSWTVSPADKGGTTVIHFYRTNFVALKNNKRIVKDYFPEV